MKKIKRIKLKRWSEKETMYKNILRQKMALSFGDFETESRVRTDLIEAIRACDESKICEIKVPGYGRNQTQDVLRRCGIYQYTVQEIAERRKVIENQLVRTIPVGEVESVKAEVFAALRLEKPKAQLKSLSPAQREKLNASGFMDFTDLR